MVAVHCSNSAGDAERIASAVDEQARHGQAWQMLDAQRVGLAGRMQRIRDQHQTPRRQRIIGVADHHRAHPPAHRSSAEHQPTLEQRRCRVANGLQQNRCAIGRLATRLAIGKSARTQRIGATAASIANRLECVLLEPAPGTAAGSCQQDPARFAETFDLLAGHVLVAAVVGMDSRNLDRNWAITSFLVTFAGAHREAQQLQRPRLRVRHRRQASSRRPRRDWR